MRKYLLNGMLLLLTIGTAGQQPLEFLGKQELESARQVRINQLRDPVRPQWHLTIAEGRGMPFDPNGAIFKDGVYHLWYLYQVNDVHHWQHLSSLDLFHWRWHPNDLKPNPGDPERGIFSGNAFIAADGNVVMAYHGLGTDGNCIAYSRDSELGIWEKPEHNPIVHPGWDPHMWMEGGTYYQISGGKPVVSGEPNPPVLYTGKAYDMPMQLVGNFMSREMPDVDPFEDISCPDFFKLDDKWVLLCISHQRGARYYIGEWDGKEFNPETHHRMNWKGGSVFAPETLLDDKGRRIMWAWILDRKTGVSSGTMTMPRVLSLSADKRSLQINPPEEIENLRYNFRSMGKETILEGQSLSLGEIRGNAMELDITINAGTASRFGVKVFRSPDGREETTIRIDRTRGLLQIDMSKSSLKNPAYSEFIMQRENPGEQMSTQDAPFEIHNNEQVRLRIFLDKSILEVFANGRQCISQVVYPTSEDAGNIEIFSEDGKIAVEEVKAWDLFPAMQW